MVFDARTAVACSAITTVRLHRNRQRVRSGAPQVFGSCVCGGRRAHRVCTRECVLASQAVRARTTRLRTRQHTTYIYRECVCRSIASRRRSTRRDKRRIIYMSVISRTSSSPTGRSCCYTYSCIYCVNDVHTGYCTIDLFCGCFFSSFREPWACTLNGCARCLCVCVCVAQRDESFSRTTLPEHIMVHNQMPCCRTSRSWGRINGVWHWFWIWQVRFSHMHIQKKMNRTLNVCAFHLLKKREMIGVRSIFRKVWDILQ